MANQSVSSAASVPPRRMYSRTPMATSSSRWRGSLRRKYRSSSSFAIPNRAPLIWCDIPPVAMTRTRSSPGNAATLARRAAPSDRSRLAVGSGWRIMFTAIGVTGTGHGWRMTYGSQEKMPWSMARSSSDREVELALDELPGQVEPPGQVPVQVGQCARPPPLVGLAEPGPDADRERRVVVQVEVV